jgi:Ca-activated chloride channel family protein
LAAALLVLSWWPAVESETCPGLRDDGEPEPGVACPDGPAVLVMPSDVVDETAVVDPSPAAAERPEQPFNPDRTAGVEVPREVGSGSQFEVSWTGPDNTGDYLSIALPGEPGVSYRNYAYTSGGSPLQLQAPDEPGDYEVRYVQHQSRTILARRDIEVQK